MATKKSSSKKTKPQKTESKPAKASEQAGTSSTGPAATEKKKTATPAKKKTAGSTAKKDKTAKTSGKAAPESTESTGSALKATAEAMTEPVQAGHQDEPDRPRKGKVTPSAPSKAHGDELGELLEDLSFQMASTVQLLQEFHSDRQPEGRVVETNSLDRATSMFRRLISQVIDDKLGEILPPLVGLRNEMHQRLGSNGTGEQADYLQRWGETLDQVLAKAEVQRYSPGRGDAFDPLIHLAVGETEQAELADDVIAETLQPGFRTLRGKVITPARVKVNRR